MSQEKSESGKAKEGVYSKEQAKAEGIKIRLRTRDQGIVDPLTVDATDPSMFGTVPLARRICSKALAKLEGMLDEGNSAVSLEVAKAIFDGTRAIAALEGLSVQVNTLGVHQHVDPSGNFDRTGVGPDIPLDLDLSDADRAHLETIIGSPNQE